MDELGMNVLTITMLEDMIFSTISNCHELTFLLSFSTLLSLWDFFELSSTCPIPLMWGTRSMNTVAEKIINALAC
jgi:hypothetical protein